MAAAISGTARILTALCDTVKVVESCEKMFEARDRGSDALLEKAAVVNRLVLLGFTAVQVGMVIGGSKSEALTVLKSIEMLPRVVNLPISMGIELSHADGTARSVIRVVEKGFIAPMADICRVGAEADAYYEHHFLQMSPEELKNAKRPIYEQRRSGEDTYFEIVGYKPVDIEECKVNLARADATATGASIVRAVAELGAAETVTANVAIPFYGRLTNFFRPAAIAARRPAPPAGPAPLVPAPLPAFPADISDAALEMELVNYPRIPVPLWDDEVFRRFICPIRDEPIRDPVRDPVARTTLYEREAITIWLINHPTSPVTRQPLTVAQLLEAPAVKAVIDGRLAHHAAKLRAYLQLQLNDPVSPADQAVIDQYQ